MADVLAFTGLEEGSVMTLKANTASAGGNDFTIFNIACEEAGWGGERFVELDLGMGEATRLRDMLDFLIKHEAAHALHKAKQQYNAAIDTQVNSMVDEFESQASSTPEQRKARKSQTKPMFVPRGLKDFDDGGAFPEIHVAQYPRHMGNPHLAKKRAGDRKSWLEEKGDLAEIVA